MEIKAQRAPQETRANSAPTQSPAPAPSTEPGERFDFSSIDTPVEALFLPGADLVASLALTQLSQNAQSSTRATVEVGDQKLEYTTTSNGNGTDINGKLNGQDFQLKSDIKDESVVLAGDTSGGRLETTLSAALGGFNVEGKIGSVDYQEAFSLDPTAGFSGHIGDLKGHFGADAYNASLKQDGDLLKVSGNLGARAIEETVTQGPNGTVIIEGTIGTVKFHEELAKA